MAYTHSKYEVQMRASGGSADVLASGTGRKVVWQPGFIPHIIRAVSITPLTTKAPVTAPVFSFRSMATAGTASATGDQFTNVSLVTKAKLGWAYYRQALDTEVKPGGEVELNVSTAATVAFPCRAILYIEPRWETPANATGNMATG